MSAYRLSLRKNELFAILRTKYKRDSSYIITCYIDVDPNYLLPRWDFLLVPVRRWSRSPLYVCNNILVFIQKLQSSKPYTTINSHVDEPYLSWHVNIEYDIVSCVLIFCFKERRLRVVVKYELHSRQVLVFIIYFYFDACKLWLKTLVVDVFELIKSWEYLHFWKIYLSVYLWSTLFSD